MIKDEQKQFIAEFTPEAEKQLAALDMQHRIKIAEAITTFELVGIAYKNINDLGDGLFEIKPKGVRAYFMYDANRRRIIIVGFVCLKKTQEAPKRYMKQARQNIRNYILQELKNLQENIK